MANVYVILLNWNGWEDTIECLESLMHSQYPRFSVVVCDNLSSDGSLEKIKAWADGDLTIKDRLNPQLKSFVDPPVEKPVDYIEYNRTQAETGGEPDDKPVPLVLVQNGSNDGFSAGNNVGIRYAMSKNADYIWLLNNDTIVTSTTMKELVYRMQTDEHTGVAGAVIHYAKKPSMIQAYGGGKLMPIIGTDRFFHAPAPLHYVSGTSMFIKREVIEQTGMLDDGFFFYWEDVDYSRRALDLGWKLAVASNAMVYHKFSSSVGGQSLRSDRYKAASLVRYFKKHGKLNGFFPIMVNISGMVFKRLLRGQFNRIFPILKVAVKNDRI